MTANERLAAWMVIEGLADKEVGQRLGLDPAYVFRVRKGTRPVTAGFRWRFSQAYGYEQTIKVLGESVQRQRKQPAANEAVR